LGLDRSKHKYAEDKNFGRDMEERKEVEEHSVIFLFILIRDV
jgi:hypothetical protein